MGKQKQVGSVVDTVLVELAVGPIPVDSFLSRYVAIGNMTEKQARAMRRILQGCLLSGATLLSGGPVRNTTDALRWLLEQVDCGE